MKLSIVTTMYYSASYIVEFYKRISKSAKKITDDYEIILVNDGSPDNSLQKSLELFSNDNNIKIIDLSRNFGHHKAIMTGLGFTKGDYVFLIDADLEEEPELLEVFWKTIQENSAYDVVYGVQKKRKGIYFEKTTGNIFYSLHNFLSPTKIPRNLVTVRLMNRNYVKALLEFREQELFLGGVFASTGFNQHPIYISKGHKNCTTYNLRRKLLLFLNSLISFSDSPLRFIFFLGITISLISVIIAIYWILRKLLLGISIAGWTSVIVSLWMLGGIIIFAIGLVGIYISKIFIEVKKRPYTIIKKVYESKDN